MANDVNQFEIRKVAMHQFRRAAEGMQATGIHRAAFPPEKVILAFVES